MMRFTDMICRNLWNTNKMKNLKYILYCSGLALLLASCDTENIVRDAEIELAKPMKNLYIEKDSSFDCGFPETLSCRDVFIANDSVMLLYDNIASSGTGNCFYKAYSLDDYSYKGEFLRAGRGPGEVLFPEIVGTFRSAEDGKVKCYLWDMMLSQSYVSDFQEAMEGTGNAVEKISDLPSNTIDVVPYQDSLQLVVNVAQGKILFHLIDRNGEILKTFRLYPDNISAERYLPIFSNSIVVNSEKSLVALIMLAIPQVNFLNLNDGSVHSVAVDKTYRNWKNILSCATRISDYMQSKQYYNNAESTPDYILALYLDRKRDDIAKGILGQSPCVHIFNWEGDFLYNLHVTEDISKIAYDSKRKFMYGLDINEGSIYRYDLSGLL